MSGRKIARLADIRFWLYVIVAMALVAELLQTALNGRPTSIGFFPGANVLNILYFIGAFAGVPACVVLGANLSTRAFKITAIPLLALGVCLYVYQLVLNDGSGLPSASTIICLIVSPLGVGVIAYSCFYAFKNEHADGREMAKSFFYLAGALGALSIATNSGLHNNRLIYPATWDYFVYRIDASYGGLATAAAQIYETAPPAVQAATFTIYSVLIFGFYAVLALAIRKGDVARLNVWRTLFVPFGLAFFLYAFLPLSGPIYAFFSGEFPNNMPAAATVAAAQVVIPPTYRNGMPSMHLTGALLVWMLSVGLRNRPAVAAATILVLGTLWATLALGEHYVIDLVVALPYAAFLGAFLIWPGRLREKVTTSGPIWLAAAIFVLWLVLIRVVPNWLFSAPNFVRALSALSVLSAITVFWGIFRDVRKNATTELRKEEKFTPAIGQASAPRWVVMAFVVSGMAGLIYEVVYSKALAVTFGSTALASYTVLATYMGGMALGAWLGGFLADHTKHPLRLYAFCELLIGVYAVATPQLFDLIQAIYVHIGLDVPSDTSWLTPLRLALGAACLGIPTILMGATLPLMFKYLRTLGVSSSGSISRLYAANVAGAAMGSVIAGYFVLPAVGRNGGTYIAAIVSLMIALYVLDKQKKTANSLLLPVIGVRGQSFENIIDTASVKIFGATAILILFVGGAITLGLEVNSMHLLAIVAGNSVYAFGLMLATFLAGLGVGSIMGENFIRKTSRINILIFAQCGIALTVAITAHIWDDIPSYFASFGLYPIPLSFSAREAIRAMVCMIAMFPPAFFIGMCYPAAMSLATDWLSPNGEAKGVGIASALNTLGNILGVVVVGFWLLPNFGSRNAALAMGVLAATLGAMALLAKMSGRTGPKFTQSKMGAFANAAPVLVAAVALCFFPKNWNYDDLSTGSNVYFNSQNWGSVIDHAESVEGGLTTVAKNKDGVSILLTNGKFQGNNSAGGEMLAQESFALFPLMHTKSRNSALVIGYGTGMTARVFHDLGFARIDVAELSHDIVKMADRHFGNINSKISSARGVEMHYTDGRNFLLTQSRRFDVISIEITSIWFAGAANLYNTNFYSLAKSRLAEKGVLQQWIQLHHISTLDLVYAIGSVRSEFKYIWLYVRGGQGIIVASNDIDALSLPGEELLARSTSESDRELQPSQLKSHLLLSPEGVDKLISSFDPTMQKLVSTDQNLYLEHSTPKGNALGDVAQQNIEMLAGFEPKVKSMERAAD